MNLTQIFIRDLIKASGLSDREKEIILQRLEGKTLQEIAKTYGITRERIRQYEEKIIRKLKEPARLGLSYRGYLVKMYEEPINGGHREVTPAEMDQTSIEVLPIPIRIINAMALTGIITLGQAKQRLPNLWRARNIGPKSVRMVKEALEKYYGQTL